MKALLTTAFLLASTSAATAWSVEEMNKVIDQSNFSIENRCSGTLISLEQRLILTAYHCIDGEVRITETEVRKPDGTIEEVRKEHLDEVTIIQRYYDRHRQIGSTTYQTEIVAHKQERDLALLQVVGDGLRSTLSAQVLPPDAPIWRGDRVIAVGNMRGLDSSVTSGVISSLNRAFKLYWTDTEEEIPLIQYDAAAAPGSSGGALYDSNGYLIGVTVAGRVGEYILAIPAEEIHTFLDENCFASAYDPEADDDACREEKESDDTDSDDGDSAD